MSIVAALALTLSGSPTILSSKNLAPGSAYGPLATTHSPARACQDGEVLPAGTSAIRLGLLSDMGPRVSVAALSAGGVLASGARGSGWTGGAVTVPVRPVVHKNARVRICLELGATKEQVKILGETQRSGPMATGRHGVRLPGRFMVEYVRTGGSTWWSLATAVARRLGLGRAWAGAWIAPVLALLMGVAVAGASLLLVKELR